MAAVILMVEIILTDIGPSLIAMEEPDHPEHTPNVERTTNGGTGNPAQRPRLTLRLILAHRDMYGAVTRTD